MLGVAVGIFLLISFYSFNFLIREKEELAEKEISARICRDQREKKKELEEKTGDFKAICSLFIDFSSIMPYHNTCVPFLDPF